MNNIGNRICLQRLVSVVKFIAERLAFRADENVESPRTFFQKIFKTSFKEMTRFLSSEDAMLLVTGFATVSQIANHSQIPCCIILLCYSWVKKCNVTILRHKYQWYVEILVTSWIIPYPNILYQPMGPPTTPGPQAPHHLNPALTKIQILLRNITSFVKKFQNYSWFEDQLQFVRGFPNIAIAQKQHPKLFSSWYNYKRLATKLHSVKTQKFAQGLFTSFDSNSVINCILTT